MGMRFAFFVARRHIAVRLKSTLLILLGVGIGVFVMTFMQSMMFGFQGEFMRVLYTTVPSILVKGRPRGSVSEGRVFQSQGKTLYGLTRIKPVEKEKGIRNYQARAKAALEIPGVLAVAPMVQGRAILRYGTRDRGINLIAVQAPSYDRVVEFRSKVTGDVDEFTRRHDGIILGGVLAEEMGVVAGNRVRVVGGEGREADMRVIAFFKSGITPVDKTFAFVNLTAGQSLLDFPGAATGMAIKVRDGTDATAAARRVEYALGLETQSWEETNANFFALIRQQNSITFIAVGMTLLVAGFGIANGLITAVLEKRKDIGILRALGVTARGIALIFVVEGIIMGILGVVVGLLLGAWVIDITAHTRLPGRGGLSNVNTFVMERGAWVYALSAGFALFVSTVASLFPALRAAKYDPVDIIRTAK